MMNDSGEGVGGEWCTEEVFFESRMRRCRDADPRNNVHGPAICLSLLFNYRLDIFKCQVFLFEFAYWHSASDVGKYDASNAMR